MGTRAFTSSQIGWLREAALRATPHERAAARERHRAERIRAAALASVLLEHTGNYPFNARVKLGQDGVPLGLEWSEAPETPDLTDDTGTVPAHVDP